MTVATLLLDGAKNDPGNQGYLNFANDDTTYHN